MIFFQNVGYNSPILLLNLHRSCFCIYCCCIMPNEQLDNQSRPLPPALFPKWLFQQVYKEQPPQLSLTDFPTLQNFIAERISFLCCSNMPARRICKWIWPQVEVSFSEHLKSSTGRWHSFQNGDVLLFHRCRVTVRSKLPFKDKKKGWLPVTELIERQSHLSIDIDRVAGNSSFP